MWMIEPAAMCRQHLLGEHVECHMFRGSLLKGTTLTGFLGRGLLDSRRLVSRHDQLAQEMLHRGYRHASPLPEDFDINAVPGEVDVQVSMAEITSRCEDCRRLQTR
jgi:hypothetical protein